ncbi:MAG: thiamine phosphate synthase [Sphingobacteriaceae bacterium]|nr:MAG: thiamine phosphate synthase [Sphingobacteriaceae bacterium]
MKLIVISSPDDFPQEAELINQLFEAGMNVFHLRKPGKSMAGISSLLKQINPKYLHRIALHQHHFLAVKNSIRRLHFTAEMRNQKPKEHWQTLKSYGFTLSTSVHQVDGIEQQQFDYVFLSPVFNSISKAGYAGFADASFILQKTKNQPEVIALGGIDATNIHQLKTMNFDGAAVLGSIWQKPEQAVSNFKMLQKKLP